LEHREKLRSAHAPYVLIDVPGFDEIVPPLRILPAKERPVTLAILKTTMPAPAIAVMAHAWRISASRRARRFPPFMKEIAALLDATQFGFNLPNGVVAPKGSDTIRVVRELQ